MLSRLSTYEFAVHRLSMSMASLTHKHTSVPTEAACLRHR